MDAVMALALALNETLGNQNQSQNQMGAQFVNQNLSDALQATMFTGASVS